MNDMSNRQCDQVDGVYTRPEPDYSGAGGTMNGWRNVTYNCSGGSQIVETKVGSSWRAFRCDATGTTFGNGNASLQGINVYQGDDCRGTSGTAANSWSDAIQTGEDIDPNNNIGTPTPTPIRTAQIALPIHPFYTYLTNLTTPQPYPFRPN